MKNITKKQVLKAVDESLAVWTDRLRKIVGGERPGDTGPYNCPLCRCFNFTYRRREACKECPLGQIDRCGDDGSAYSQYNDNPTTSNALRVVETIQAAREWVEENWPEDAPRKPEFEFKLGGKYKLRNGENGMVVYKHAGFMTISRGVPGIPHFMVKDNGRFDEDGAKSPFDLMPPEPEKFKVNKWANGYRDGATVHPDRDAADTIAAENRIACIPIEIEFYEGQGLEPEK